MKQTTPDVWNPDVYECPNCKKEVYSKSPGNWVPCACFKNEVGNLGGYVDQTKHYTRVGGNLIYKRKLIPERNTE